jgi:hypothetical protein
MTEHANHPDGPDVDVELGKFSLHQTIVQRSAQGG